MRYSRDQLLEIQPSTPNFELVNGLRELRLGVGLPRKRGCRGGRKKLRSIKVVPSRNLHPLMVPPFLQPHPDLQSAVGNAPLSSKHPTHLLTTDCLLSITPLMGGQPSDAPALSPPSPLQQGGQSSNAPALSPPSPLPQGSQPIALALSPSSPPPQDGQPSDAPGLSPSSSTLLLCPSDSPLSICHLNSQSAVKTGWLGNGVYTSVALMSPYTPCPDWLQGFAEVATAVENSCDAHAGRYPLCRRPAVPPSRFAADPLCRRPAVPPTRYAADPLCRRPAVLLSRFIPFLGGIFRFSSHERVKSDI
ncbi:hypothetical protein ACOMHN_032717 [Nucella lapillus]